MTNIEFDLPPQCRNCISLHESVEKCRETIDVYNNSALNSGMQAERKALEASEAPGEYEVEAINTGLLLEAAAFIGKNLVIQTEHEMAVARLWCNGTRDPNAPQLLPCNFLQSALE